MTAEEFLTEQGLTKEKMDNENLYSFIVNLMESFAALKQMEAIEQVRLLVKEHFDSQKNSTIIMP
jgi:hypothetical protein